MAFNKEKQNVSASQLLQAVADGQDIHLSLCTVTGPLDVNRLFESGETFDISNLNLRQNPRRKTITFSQSIVCDRCTFEDNVVFSAPWAEPESVAVEFEADVIFNRSVFKGQSRFRNAVFQGTAGFDGCGFEGVVTFKKARFCAEAKFRTVVFHGYCLLGDSRYEGSARFTNTHFVRGANFNGVSFLGPTDFSGVYSSSRSIPNHEGVTFGRRRYGDDEGFWRFVKQSAQDAGYYQMSGESFYRERCARLRQKFLGTDFDRIKLPRKAMRTIIGLRLLPEVVFGKMLFGYGERPVRVLLTSALIIVFCGLAFSQDFALYSDAGAEKGSWLQGMYFSTITFTTLGYGDLYPAPQSGYRALAMAEAISGGCLIALFVVCLAKRFSRG
jgi:hypothetical protein